MYSIIPSQTELFHFRLLLLTVKADTSFEDLRTVDNKICDTFHGACLELGLIEDDGKWERAMTEGEIWMIHCHSNSPGELWEKFKNPQSEDFQRKHSLSNSHSKAYHEINNLLSHILTIGLTSATFQVHH